MSDGSSKESHIPSVSHLGSSVKRQSSLMDNACDTRQNRHGSILLRAGLLTAALPQPSLQGTSINLQSALTLLLSRMDKMESNITNITKTNNFLHERISSQEQDKVLFHPDSSRHQGDNLGGNVRSSSKDLRLFFFFNNFFFPFKNFYNNVKKKKKDLKATIRITIK